MFSLGIIRCSFFPDLSVLCLIQFPNEEDSFHKFVSPQEVLPFTEGTGFFIQAGQDFFFFEHYPSL